MKNLLRNNLFKNFAHLFSGDIIVSILSIFSIGFITKTIGLEEYGLIILIQGVISLIDGFFNFQSWQGFIKFYSEKKDDKLEVRKLIKFSYIQDIVTAGIAFVILNIIANFIGDFYNFNKSQEFLLRVFSLGILFNIQGTPIGILRSFNRFDRLRDQKIFVGVFNFIFLGIGMILNKNMIYFIGVYLTSNILSGILINIFTIYELKKNNIRNILSTKIKFDKEFFKFNCLTNLNSSLDIPVQYLDNLLIGKFLTLEYVGIYKICKTVTLVLDKIGAPIYQILYPSFCEEVKKYKKNVYMKKLFKISLGLFGVITLIFLLLNVIGFDILEIIFDKNIKNYKNQINFYYIVKGFGIIFVGIHPLFLAKGLIKKETFIILFSNSLYLILLYPLLKTFDLYGVILAYLVQVSTIIMLKLFIILKE